MKNILPSKGTFTLKHTSSCILLKNHWHITTNNNETVCGSLSKFTKATSIEDECKRKTIRAKNHLTI